MNGGPNIMSTTSRVASGRPLREATAAAGLSIVVPLYNEAAGLARLHARLTEITNHLFQTRSLTCEVVYVDDGSADQTLAIARELPASGLDVQVVLLAKFRQRGGAARRARSRAAWRRRVHRW